jgi:hypothetical protein
LGTASPNFLLVAVRWRTSPAIVAAGLAAGGPPPVDRPRACAPLTVGLL